MDGGLTVEGGVLWAFRILSDVAFSWIPGIVQVVAGTAPDSPGAALVYKPITEPLSSSDVVLFLQAASAPGAYDALTRNWTVFVALSVIVSLSAGTLIGYCLIRVRQIRHMEAARFSAAGKTVAARDIPKTQLRWQGILERAHSDDEKSWRLAILEADIMLNELLDTLGYRGETMADKMKQASRQTFKTIDLAWEAHRVRNEVAHEGSLRHLTSYEVRRVVGLYTQVFREFTFIA